MISDYKWAELLEDILPYDEWLRKHTNASDCCITFLFQLLGCDSACRHGWASRDWTIHLSGEEAPTPEMIAKDNVAAVESQCPTCQRGWGTDDFTAREMAHARRDAIAVNISLAISGTFDEATERARLMPV